MGVEAFDEAAVAFGFAAPAAGFGVAGEGFGVGALRGQDGQVAGVGAEVGAVLADVGVGAGALDLGADAEAAGEAGLDGGRLFPVAVDDRQRGAAAGWLGGQGAEVGFRGGQRPLVFGLARWSRTAARSAGSSRPRRARAGPSGSAGRRRR